jgi:3-oxoacyl-[acyl-carrier-protein] synthase-3
MGTRIVGFGKALPSCVVTNVDLERRGLDTTHEWIVGHTGIHERRICSSHEDTTSLAAIAASRALLDADIEPVEVGYTIVATSTPAQSLPATASLVQDLIRAGGGAIDINAGCSGFVQALIVGFGLQRTCRRPVVVIGSDAYSKTMVSQEDRLLTAFFGDGAGAVVLNDVPSGQDALRSCFSRSRGSASSALEAPLGGRLVMNGREVRNFVLAEIPPMLRELSETSGIPLDRMTFVPHQANAIMLGELADRAGVDRARMFLNVQRHGNTAAASVPIALAEARESGALGEFALIAGFGAGLAWAGAVLEID